MSDEAKKVFASPAEDILAKFPEELQVGARSHNWQKRIVKEVDNLKTYLEFTKQNDQEWFRLVPNMDRKNNFQIWEGEIYVPGREDISFEIRIILPPEYPKVYPQGFVEKRMVDFGPNIFYERIWDRGETKQFVQMCHELLDNHHFWTPDLSIAHYLLRQVLTWWNSVINVVVKKSDGLI